MWLGFILLALAMTSIYLFFVSTPLQAVLPWLSPLLAIASLAIILIGLRRAQTQPVTYGGKAAGWTLTVLSSLVLLFGILFFFVSRHIPAAGSAPQVGQKAPDFTLPDSNGHSVSLAQLVSGADQRARPKAVLVVFYRGYW